MKSRTRQRAAILEVIRREKRPLTAEEIHQLARELIPSIGLSTVYRSIRKMAEEQQLIGVDFPGQPPRYELPTRDLHSHFVCTLCERVFDLPHAPQIPPTPLPPGFESHGYEVVVFGHCPDCARNHEGSGDANAVRD